MRILLGDPVGILAHSRLLETLIEANDHLASCQRTCPCERHRSTIRSMAEAASAGAIDLTGGKIHSALESGMSCGTYLEIEKNLNARSLRSEHHDEMQFIVIGQVSEPRSVRTSI